MFETIIVGYDGSDGADDALNLANRLARPSTQITAVCVTERRTMQTAGRLAAPPHDSGQQVAARAYVSPAVADGLHGCAQELGADLIVVGSSHRGALGRLLLGDDARRTLHGAACPVATAPRGYRDEEGIISAIGVAYDAGDESRAAMELATGIAAATGASVRAVQVIAAAPALAYAFASGSASETLKRELFLAQSRLGAFGDVEGTAITGDPAEELLRLAREVDLFALGLVQHGPAHRLLLGSITEALASRSPRPLLLVPAATDA
jgi:nucleotide-binding universal stress UspA family protein